MKTTTFAAADCKLSIIDLQVWVFLGCTDQEKNSAQCVSFTIDFIFAQPPQAMITDQLTDTICYFNIVEQIKLLCKKKHFNLIEHLTAEVYHLLQNILAEKLMYLKQMNITTHKLSPPVLHLQGGVTFTQQYSRDLS